MLAPAMAVDLLRVAVISQQSGWYIDADIAPTKPRLFETDSSHPSSGRPSSGFAMASSMRRKGTRFFKSMAEGILGEALQKKNWAMSPESVAPCVVPCNYLYALEAGAQVSRTHLQTLPGVGRIYQLSRDVGTVWSKFFRRHSWVVHVAATSWLPKPPQLKGGNFLYELRRTRVGLGLEILRQLLTAPSVPPIRRSDWYLIANMDNTVLDSGRTGPGILD